MSAGEVATINSANSMPIEELVQNGNIQQAQWHHFSEGLVDMLTGLTRAATLSSAEEKFVTKVADLSSRNLMFWLGQHHLQLPLHDPATVELLGRMRDEVEFVSPGTQDRAEVYNRHSVMRLLHEMSAAPIGISERPYIRAHVEDYAINILKLTGMVIDHNGPLAVNEYLQDNLQNIIDHRENAHPPEPEEEVFTPQDYSEAHYTRDAKKQRELWDKVQQTGRHFIGRDSKVIEGVYGGDYGQELIVVDFKDHRQLYGALVEKVKHQASKTTHTAHGLPQQFIDKSLIFDSVLDVVSQAMPYSLEGVDSIFQAAGGKDYTLIPLSRYVEQAAGVCRQQVLLGATILELLRSQNVISGTARVNRSQQWPEKGDSAGHAWIKYVNSNGEVYIIDIAQGFIGTIEEARKRPMGWNYDSSDGESLN